MVKKPHSKGRHFQIKIFFFKTYLLLNFLTILYMYTVYLVWAVQMAQSLKARLTTKGQHSLLSASPKKSPDTTYTSPPLSWPLYSWSFFLFNPLSPVKLSAWMLTGIPSLILSRQPKHCCEFLGALPSQVQRTAFQNTPHPLALLLFLLPLRRRSLCLEELIKLSHVEAPNSPLFTVLWPIMSPH